MALKVQSRFTNRTATNESSIAVPPISDPPPTSTMGFTVGTSSDIAYAYIKVGSVSALEKAILAAFALGVQSRAAGNAGSPNCKAA